MIRRGTPRHAGRRRGQGRLDPRAAEGARAGQPREARRRRRSGRLRQARSAAALHRRRLRRPRHLHGAAPGARGRAASRCTTWPSRRACSRPWSSSSRSRAAPTARASWSRSRSAATSPRPQELNRVLHSVLPRDRDLPHRPLPRQGGGPEHPLLPLRQLVPRADLEPQLRAERPDHDGRELRRRRGAASSTRRPAPSATWCRTTCCRWSRCWRGAARRP